MENEGKIVQLRTPEVIRKVLDGRESPAENIFEMLERRRDVIDQQLICMSTDTEEQIEKFMDDRLRSGYSLGSCLRVIK